MSFRGVPSDRDSQHPRASPTQKTLSRAATAEWNGSSSTRKSSVGSHHIKGSPAATTDDAPEQPAHQRFVLTDPVAFRYLEEDPSTTVLGRRRQLEGYDCYIVEQWTTSRTHPTFCITTYTGDPSHKIVVDVLSVPTDESAWSPRLRVYFKALNQYHARRRETPLGIITVTNLSGFPSSLTVIPVPDGDLKKHREDFLVNENLKRLGCSGRVGFTLGPPSSATIAKFHQLYRTSDKIPLYSAVIELVKLCQAALVLFANLEPEYADGLLCDVTEKAINDWWIELGSEYYNIEPHDGILGPTTVAALLGMLMGARNRLNAYGAPVAKDVFDTGATKRGIAYFQRSQRISKSRRLDRQTLNRLHKATAKAASGGASWTVPRAVKSTVAELSGKGGEMVMDAVGRRDKAGIAEIETVDIERFVQLVHGERAKWLWYGKAMKSSSGSGDMFNRLPGDEGLIFQKDDQGGYAWSGKRRDSTNEESGTRKRDHASYYAGRPSIYPGMDDVDKSDQLRKQTVLKRASGRMNDARSGLGRIKDVVGLRSHGHHARQSRDGIVDEAHQSPLHSNNNDSKPILRRTRSTPTGSPTTPQGADDTWDRTTLTQQVTAPDTDRQEPFLPGILIETPHASRTTLFSTRSTIAEGDEQAELGASPAPEGTERSGTSTAAPSMAESTYHGIDLDEVLPTASGPAEDIGPLLQRTRSFSQYTTTRLQTPRNDDAYPRHLSFSIASDSVLTWTPIASDSVLTWTPIASFSTHDNGATRVDPKLMLTKQLLLAFDAKLARASIALLSSDTGAWAQRQLEQLQELSHQADLDIRQLQSLYNPRLDAFEALKQQSGETIMQTRQHLSEGVKEVETLAAKLEYELGGLRGKVGDVEDSVEDFEKK
ncbi:hypothetical protein LTR60_000842, partial [Cryomyces antarcticus]